MLVMALRKLISLNLTHLIRSSQTTVKNSFLENFIKRYSHFTYVPDTVSASDGM